MSSVVVAAASRRCARDWALARSVGRIPAGRRGSRFHRVFGPAQRQARLTFNYCRGLLKSRPDLEALIVRETANTITTSTGVTLEVLSATMAAPRGRSYALAVVEEAAYLPQTDSANPDVELLRALRPALARVPGSLLAVVSSPYAKRGILWQAWQQHQDGGRPGVAVVHAPTLLLNPQFDKAAVDQAFKDDPASARAEFSALFRDDIESYVSVEAVRPVSKRACGSVRRSRTTRMRRLSIPPAGRGKTAWRWRLHTSSATAARSTSFWMPLET